MNEKKMKTCLVGVSIPEWISLINSRIFFFASKEKADVLLGRYASYENLLLEVDTSALLSEYAQHVSICRINAGAFVRKPVPRGRDTFIPLSNYIYKKKRNVAEVTLDTPIPNILAISRIL